MKKEKKIGILTVILAAICCALPIILLSLGVGSLSIGAFIENYGSYFFIAGIIILVFAFYMYYKKRKIMK
jgi:LPXTG-motif cell wall-anchored protein